MLIVCDDFGRCVTVCEVEPGQFGRHITEMVDGVEEEVTAFMHSTRPSMNTLEAVLKNLVGRYQNIKYIAPGAVADEIAEILERIVK